MAAAISGPSGTLTPAISRVSGAFIAALLCFAPAVLPSLGLVSRKIRGKEAVDLGVRHQVREPGEAALRLQRLCGAHEAGPRRQCQRTADADASHAECRNVLDTQPNVPDHEEVERLRGNSLYERLDFCRLLWTRGEEHIRPRRRV